MTWGGGALLCTHAMNLNHRLVGVRHLGRSGAFWSAAILSTDSFVGCMRKSTLESAVLGSSDCGLPKGEAR